MVTKKETPDRMDVRVPEELRERLEEVARREDRSRNAQAAYYIKMGLAGLSPEQLAQRVDSIEAKLDEILRRLAEK